MKSQIQPNEPAKPFPDAILKSPVGWNPARSFIPVFKPSFGDEELEALREVFQTGWLGMGPKVKEFEKRFADYAGVKHAVAVNSCTAALHLALVVLDIKDREVITTPLTFVSTNHAILYNGGIPVFCDVEPDTLNLDPESIEKLITPKTRAIVCVHYGGHACEMDRILAIAEKHGLDVVEDVAHGAGGGFRGRKLGSLGKLGCFSFHAVKNMSTGDGGMILTDDGGFMDRLAALRWMGITKDTWDRGSDRQSYAWAYDVREIGYKYQMNDIAGALGLVQLGKLNAMNAQRRALSRRYDQAFAGIDWITLPVTKPYADRSHHNYVIQIEDRDALNVFLQERGIATGVHYLPNHHYSMYREHRGETPVADRVWKRLLTLPLFPDLSEGEIEYIIDSVLAFGRRT